MRSTPHLSELSPTSPLKQSQCSSGWWWFFLSRPFRDDRLALQGQKVVSWIQTHKRFKRTLFIRTRQNQQIFRVIPLQENNKAQQKQISGLACHLIFHRFLFFLSFFFFFFFFLPFNCCLRVFLQLDKGDYLKICRFCLVLINSILFNLLCVWILF